jgi:endonuclease I
MKFSTLKYHSLFATIFFYFSNFIGTNAQIPNYYDPINLNLTGEGLKTELAQLISETQFASLVYTPGVWNALKQTDLDPENSSRVLLLYGSNDHDGLFQTDRTRNVNATCSSSNCIGFWNREHVYPRSLGNPNLGFEGPGSDVHHLRATDFQMNSLRGNKRFTNSNGNAQAFGSFFYPGDEWKGDVARMMMYMYLRYGFQCLPNNVGSGFSNISPLGDMPTLFLQWNAEDPVQPHEIVRNNVLENLQGNRNPFIDNPYLATLIWGGPQAQDFWGILSQDAFETQSFKVYPTVTDDVVFVQNNSQTTGFELKIINLSGQVLRRQKNESSISLSQFPSGMYFIVLSNGQQNQSFKVVKK